MTAESRDEDAPRRSGRSLGPRPRPQLMNPDGSFAIKRIGLSSPGLRDAYHSLRTTTWPRTFASITAAWLGSNVAFAFSYLAGGDCISGARPGSFIDAFFFSVQTFSTIGYGGLSPTTDYANAIVVVEAFYGLLFAAVTTGLIFAKIAAPTARLMFTRDALITDAGGKRVLTFRVANTRESHIVEAAIRVSLARDEADDHGSIMRRLYDLKLIRDTSPLLALTWTVVHEIDEDSPLHEVEEGDLRDGNVTLLVTVRGIEDRLAASVHARHAYLDDRICFDRRHVDILKMTPDGERYVDYRVFHDHEPS